MHDVDQGTLGRLEGRMDGLDKRVDELKADLKDGLDKLDRRIQGSLKEAKDDRRAEANEIKADLDKRDSRVHARLNKLVDSNARILETVRRLEERPDARTTGGTPGRWRGAS